MSSIFWLEDNPYHVDILVQRARSRNPPVDLSCLLRSIDFAYDYEMGADTVRSAEPFGLYILDADFPQRLSDERRASFAGFIDALRRGERPHYNAGGHREEFVLNNFLRFYREQLGPQCKSVIFSQSRHAAVAAFNAGLPFYFKWPSGDPLYATALGGAPAAWEHGDRDAFLERYLLPPALDPLALENPSSP
jgi:hypothetical protein